MRLIWRVLDLFVCGLFVLCFRGRVFGVRHVPRRGGALLVANHQSYFDPILVAMPLPRESSFMARDSLFRNPPFARMIRFFNAFPVRRGTPDLGAIREAIRRLKRGEIVIVFPEATRTRDGSIGAMSGGVVILARRARVPIVPVLIHGAYECWPRDRRWPRLSPITLSYGEPLRAEEVERLDDADCIDILRRRIIAMAQRVQRR